MKNNDTRRASALSVAFGAAWVTVLIAPPAFAQQNIERVEITGSSIKRIDAETALPVQVVSRQEIEATGAANVEQFLQGLGVALQGNSNSVAATGSGATTGGVSSVSLRGLGSQRTLVLIDGKRVSAGGTLTDSTTVDVNHIPVAAIERIEVLKDGASAIYGSDAIGGVINFILRKDYKGGEITPYANYTQHPGGRGWGTNGLVGWGNMATDGFNATMSFDYRKQDALYGAQRDFAKSGINVGAFNDTTSGNTFPGNFVGVNGVLGTRNPFFPTGCNGGLYQTFSPLFSDPAVAGNGSRGCRFDPSPLVSLLPESEQHSVFGTLRYAFASDLEGYGQFSYSTKEQRTIIQPVPLSDQFALPPNHPLFNVAPYSTFGGVNAFLLQGPGRPNASPYYPTAFVQAQTGGNTPDLLIRYRSVITGNRDISDISDQTRVVLGLKSVIFGWDSDASFLHVDTKLTERVNNGYPSLTGILPLLNSGQVNPFGANSPAVQALADATQFRGDAWKTKTSIDGVSAKVTHDLTQLAGGPLGLAVGTDGRREGFVLDPSTAIQSGDISGYGGNFFPIDKSRLVGAGYAELVAPVVRGLELTGAMRYDHYENVGSKTSPKVGARWQPAKEVVVRGSWGKGFRAPALTELYQPQVVGVSAPGLNDPARCNITKDAKDCVTQFPITIGGNTALKPEISTNSTLGIVFEPINDASFAVDWWQVNLKETIISGISPAAILADLGKYGSYVTRAAPDATGPCTACPGQITNIAQTNTNLGETRVQGLDVDLRYRMPAAAAGVYTVGLNGTYFLKYDIQNVDGSFSSINGQVSPIVNGNGGVIPRWRHYLYVDWKLAPWNLTLAQQYQSHYQDIPGTFEDLDPTSSTFTGPQKHKTVSAYSIFHFSSSYTGLIDKNLKIAFGIRNLLDKKPPYTNAGGQNYFQGGYDPGYVDPRGRTYLLSATYKFM
jgi:iron complex outermembrane receptor protein